MSTPDALDVITRRRFTIAALRAVRRYPGPAGIILSRELSAWASFGYRLGADRAVMALVDELAGTRGPVPASPTVPSSHPLRESRPRPLPPPAA